MRSVFGYVAAVWARLRALARALLMLRVPVIAAAGGFVVMATSQMGESITVLMEDFRGLDQIAQPAFAVVGVLGAAFALWFCGRFFSLAAPLYDTSATGAAGLARILAPEPRAHDARNHDARNDPLLYRRLGYFLAVLPVFIATGYLTFCFNRFWWTMREAGVAMTYSAWFVLAVLIVAGVIFGFTVLMLIVGIIREPRSDGIIDSGTTTALFRPASGAPESPDETAYADLIQIYVWIGRGLRWLLRRLVGDIDEANNLARAYGLAPLPRPQQLTLAPTGAPASKQSAAFKMVSAAGLDLSAPKALPSAPTFSGLRRKPARPPGGVPPLGAPLDPSSASAWSQIRQWSTPWQYILMLPVIALTVAAAVLLVSPLAFFAQVQDASEWIGTMAIVQAFVVALLLVFTALYRRSDVLIILTVLAVIVARFDWNDSHHIRPLASANPGTPAGGNPTTVDEAFAQWFESRKDKARYERYPVYVVAAQGGGIYAAYHAAVFLARMQDICPAFAQHVFAISSVSGGSVGSGVFAALAKAQGLNAAPQAANAQPQNGGQHDCEPDASPTGAFKPGPIEQRVRDILARDLLSPAVSAALFPDLVLQALPVCPTDRIPYLCLKGFDRARAMELAFEDAWLPRPWSKAADAGRPDPAAAGSRNPLTESYYALWSPGDAAPAVLINTTSVETGERVVIAPFRYLGTEPSPDRTGPRQVATLLDTAPGLDLRLSTAMSISARFPLISPAAWYRMRPTPDGRPGEKRRLVDGGYFDNSGIATALDVINAVGRVAEKLPNSAPGQPGATPAVDLRLIVLTGAAQPASPDYSYGEVLSVVRGVLNAWQEHGRGVEELARRTIANSMRGQEDEPQRPQGKAPALRLSMSYAVLDTKPHPLPLGWQLSRTSRDEIQRAAGHLPALADCTKAASARARPGVLSGRDESSCTMGTIRAELMKRR